MKNKGKFLRLVGFGNSLTYGYLVSKSYLDYLKEYLPSHIEIINSGIPGDTVIDGLHRIDYSVSKYNPHITIVEFCVNDAFSGISVEKFEKYYLSLLGKINCEKIIMIPHSLYDDFDNKTVKPFYDRLKNIARKTDLPVIDVSKYRLGRNELLADKLHPNEKGYETYAREAFEVLKSEIVSATNARMLMNNDK